MERYQAEIGARDERIKESKKLGYALFCFRSTFCCSSCFCLAFYLNKSFSREMLHRCGDAQACSVDHDSMLLSTTQFISDTVIQGCQYICTCISGHVSSSVLVSQHAQDTIMAGGESYVRPVCTLHEHQRLGVMHHIEHSGSMSCVVIKISTVITAVDAWAMGVKASVLHLTVLHITADEQYCRREVPKKTRMTAPEVKSTSEEADIKKCANHFETCGWDALEFDPR